MRKTSAICIFLLLSASLMILAGCRRSCTVSLDGFTQGTYYHVIYISHDSVDLQHAIDSLLDAVDNSMSIFNDNSLLSRLNDNRTDSVDKYISDCIKKARRVSEKTDGLYDITVKPLVEAWGFAAGPSQPNPNVDSLRQFVGYDKIDVIDGRLRKSDPRMQIDLNSIAKGYTVDLVAALICSHGIRNYMVEIGGEVVVAGHNPEGAPWRVGIDRPLEGNYLPGDQTQAVIALTNRGIATSGNYRNFRYDTDGRRIVHVINPKTGMSIEGDLLSATVVASTCAVADAWGTAMIAVGKDRAIEILKSNHDISAYLIFSDRDGNYKTYISPKLQKMVNAPAGK